MRHVSGMGQSERPTKQLPAPRPTLYEETRLRAASKASFVTTPSDDSGRHARRGSAERWPAHDTRAGRLMSLDAFPLTIPAIPARRRRHERYYRQSIVRMQNTMMYLPQVTMATCPAPSAQLVAQSPCRRVNAGGWRLMARAMFPGQHSRQAKPAGTARTSHHYWGRRRRRGRGPKSFCSVDRRHGRLDTSSLCPRSRSSPCLSLSPANNECARRRSHPPLAQKRARQGHHRHRRGPRRRIRPCHCEDTEPKERCRVLQLPVQLRLRAGSNTATALRRRECVDTAAIPPRPPINL